MRAAPASGVGVGSQETQGSVMPGGGSRKKGMSRREQALRLREAGVMLSRGYSLPEGEGWRVRRPCTCQH